MSRQPDVVACSESDLFEELRSTAAAYTDWDPESSDGARALLRIYARFGADLFDKVNSAPAKHRLAFLDALDGTRRPPSPARVPVTVAVADNADRITVPGGANVLAAAGDGTETVTFEIQDGFEATGASLTDVITVDPHDERIVDHGAVLNAEPITLFEGANCREPALYLGDDLLALDAGASFVLELSGEKSLLDAPLSWEYYGTDGEESEGWHRLDQLESGDGRARFRMPGEPIQRSVDGVDTYWVRCRPEGGEPAPLSLDTVSVQICQDEQIPDAIVANDVPLATDSEPFRPFGRSAQPPATWYVTPATGVTTLEGVAEIRLDPPPEEPSPTDQQATDANGDQSSATRSAPEPSEPSVFDGPPVVSWEYYNGNGWTRIEGVEDGTDALRNAGTVRFPVPSDLTRTSVAGQDRFWVRARLVSGRYREHNGPGGGEPPRFGGIAVSHEHEPRSASAVLRRADAGYERLDLGTDTVDPFPAVSAAEPAVFLGFDETLAGGPITLFVAVDQGMSPSPSGFELDWEYWAAPAEEWRPLDVSDGTQGLTEEGIVELSLPTATAADERFGRKRHWIRARVPTASVRSRDRSLPMIEALHTNAGWAEHTETVTEVVGTSDGTPGQTFTCSETPVLDHTVWVEWDADDGFERSGLSDRHYTVDGLAGTITVGDGAQGTTPPEGDVRVRYTTGGGAVGNVDAGAVTGFDRQPSGVEAVTNPVPASGGRDAESTDALVERAAGRLRHRDRAVTPEDYERIAASAAPAVGAVTCLPADGASRDLTVVLAPEATADRPAPSATLREHVADALRARAPARVVDEDRLTVRGPVYVPVAVDATVRAQAPSVERSVLDRLEALLHPTAGNDGVGWSFGTVPDIETVRSAVTDVAGVQSVRDIDARVQGADSRPLGAGSMVCSGDHRVRVVPLERSHPHPGDSSGTERDR